ncbi:MAG: hypothetical protein Q9163_001042 [Psora crenata]
MTRSEIYSGYAPELRSGYAQTNRPSTVNKNASSWDGSQRQPLDDGINGGRGRFPHIKDLQQKAGTIIKNYEPHMPVRRLLDHADEAAKRVTTDVSFRRQDRAYIEYIVYSEILLNIIPKHKDFSALNSDRGEWQRRYRALCRVSLAPGYCLPANSHFLLGFCCYSLRQANYDLLQQNDAQNEMFKQIYNIIVEDNARSGVRPSEPILSASNRSNSASNQAYIGAPRPLSMPGTPPMINNQGAELFLDVPTHQEPLSSAQHSQHIPGHQSPSRRERPHVQAKPKGLQLYIGQHNDTSHPSPEIRDSLAERFSRLQVERNVTLQGQSSGTPPRNSTDMSSSTEYTPSSSEDSYYNNHHPKSGQENLTSPTKLVGPRQFPTSPKKPPLPPKVPWSPVATDQYEALPQPPKPAYDPARSVSSPSNKRGPTPHSKLGITDADSATPQSLSRRYGHEDIANASSPPGRSNSVQPTKTSITALELYEQFQFSSVLIIDVRSREDYDSGHIPAKCTMCIEPVSIYSGISAEELEDRLVISPEAEQGYFEQRNQFETIVYHDQATESDHFLKGSPTRTGADHLRAIHDTLYEFNNYKPLRNPPLVLVGGIKAWIDLVGPQALAASKTAGLVGLTRDRRSSGRPGRPIGRVPMASANSSLEVRKRRLREQKTLNADEERRWLEKARKEEVNPIDYQRAHSDNDIDSNGEEPPSPFIHSYEDFLRKFPEVSQVQQSMTAPVAPPPPHTRLPPSQSVPRSIHNVPSRPPPAVPRPSYSGVTERDLSQFSPVSRQSSARQQPLFTSRSVSHYLKLPRTGLINFGVTCYMNATIQCLLATIPLSQFFLDNHWRDLTQKNWKGSNGILPGIFANLVRNLWKNDAQAIRPTSLRAFCARLKDEWGVDRQQDAKEFFDFIVDCLHEDLNINFERTPLRPLTLQQEMLRERMPVREVSNTEWQRYSHREHSYISDLFAGQHASRLRCTTCRNTSTTYEAFYSISVEIPRHDRRKGWTIDDCLDSYCQEERLSGDEVWKCPYCKCEREATKQIIITRAPKFLVVHFKRFEMRKGDAKKVHTPIYFPLFGLDLGAYMVQQDRDIGAQPDESADMATTGPFIYDAYAVMRHLGSTGNGGHYISLVRDAARGLWRKFDDEKVIDFDPVKMKAGQTLQNGEAYLVFYGRAAPR